MPDTASTNGGPLDDFKNVASSNASTPRKSSACSTKSSEASLGGISSSPESIPSQPATPPKDGAYIASLESEVDILRKKLAASERVCRKLEAELAKQSVCDSSGWVHIDDASNTDTVKGTAHLVNCSRDSNGRALGSGTSNRKSKHAMLFPFRQ